MTEPEQARPDHLAAAAAPGSRGVVTAAPPAPALTLYPWQERALAAWSDARHRGVIEAVTGSGKTRLALAAMIQALEHERRVAVVVPTRDLVRQWRREIRRHVLPVVGPVTVGQLGDGELSSLERAQVVVATATSAAKHFRKYAGRKPAKVLLIADECHHYGAEMWANVLQDAFPRRLGLTATYEREDDGVARVLDPYFGGVRYSVGYREALDDGVIAHFRIAFAGVRFTGGEKAEYAEASDRAQKARRDLIRYHGIPAEPFGVFLRKTQELAKSDDYKGSRVAMRYLAAFARRRAIMAECSAKLALLEHLSPAVAAADRTIVFAQTVDAADAAIERLASRGIVGATIEASMDADEKTDAFEAFERGDLAVVAAPKLLDEGVDVPAADLAIVLATSRSRLQLIQRMGRVIRKKADGRAARIVVLYVEGTAEDPARGAHEDFLDEIVDAADAVTTFAPGTAPEETCAWLAPHPGSLIPVAHSGRTPLSSGESWARSAKARRARRDETSASGASAPAPPAAGGQAASRSGAAAPRRTQRGPRCEKCLRGGAIGSRCSCGWTIGTKAVTCPQCGRQPSGDPGERCPAGGSHAELARRAKARTAAAAPRTLESYRVCAKCSTVTTVLEGPCPTCADA